MRWILVTLGLFACSKYEPPPPIDCAARGECKTLGKCTQNLTSCGAFRDEDCAQSEVCRLHGACVAGAGRCVVRLDEDCAQAEVPASEGRIEAMGMVGGAECVRPMSDAVRIEADCMATQACHHHGLCRTVRGACRATHPEHCRASLDCARWGRCTLRGGECVAASRRDCDQGSQTRGFSAMYGHCYDPHAPSIDPATLPSTAPDVEGAHDRAPAQGHAAGVGPRG